MIFNIQRFSTHDGSGIRTIIFFKGCPLKCPWCSNPESQSFEYDVFFDKRKCIGCMECVRTSKNSEFESVEGSIVIHRENIRDPQVFNNICPTKAIEVVGRVAGVEELLAEVEKDRLFFSNSGGGVTFSGGEPFGQPALLTRLSEGLKHLDISTAVETGFDIPWENIEGTIGLIDEYLIDIKHVDSNKLKAVTGADFAQIEQNLRKMEGLKIPVTIRVSVIPGFNYAMSDMEAIIDFVSSFNNIKEIHFLPYHIFGKGKYLQMGLEYKVTAEPLNNEDMEPFVGYAQKKGLKPVLGG